MPLIQHLNPPGQGGPRLTEPQGEGGFWILALTDPPDSVILCVLDKYVYEDRRNHRSTSQQGTLQELQTR